MGEISKINIGNNKVVHGVSLKYDLKTKTNKIAGFYKTYNFSYDLLLILYGFSGIKNVIFLT